MGKLEASQISVVVPTKDRPAEIRSFLSSVRASTQRPGEIIFVFSGQDITSVLKEFSDLCVRAEPSAAASQIKQRNRGLELVAKEAKYVACFDDDITLDPHAIEKIVDFVNASEKDYGAVAFNIANTRGFRFNLFKFLFCMSGTRAGAVLPSGYNTNLCNVPRSMEVDWVFGGATLWKRNIICGTARTDHYGSYAFIEDVEFSYGVRRSFPLAVCAEARVHDLRAAGSFHKTVAFGKMQVAYRIAFVRRAGDLSVTLALWACIGQLCENLFRAIMQREPHLLRTAWGNLLGLWEAITSLASPTHAAGPR
jgi:glycosyltransferase involved in cell wall biosynthesis